MSTNSLPGTVGSFVKEIAKYFLRGTEKSKFVEEMTENSLRECQGNLIEKIVKISDRRVRKIQ